MIKRFLILMAVALLSGSQASADTVLVNDDFSYADGSLVGNGGWVTHSGTVGDLLVASGAAVVQHGTPSEDAHVQFTTQMAGLLRAEFDIVVNDDVSPLAGTDFEYFAHFMSDGQFNFRSRLDIQSPNAAGGDYTLGISSDSSTAEATLLSDFNFGDTVSVILDFDLDTGIGSLTVGSETISGSASGVGQSLDSFGLRQSDSSGNETILVDNLVVTAVMAIPEPSSGALLGMFGLVGAIRRRK